MSITIQHRLTGATIKVVEADSLRYADLRGAKLSGADLSNSDLSNSVLRNSDLSNSDLSNSDLSNAYLCNADLRGADLRDAKGITAPVIPQLDDAILAAVESGGSLEMSKWHSCETTHCRAGWAIHLAGTAGQMLEDRIGPLAAGALIYHASTGHVPDFFATNEEAMADIRACAEKARSAPPVQP